MSGIHRLKTWPKFFRAVRSGRKTFEVRRFDRPFRSQDRLLLEEWDPDTGKYTGAQITKRITYIMKGGAFGIAADYCVLGLGAP